VLAWAIAMAIAFAAAGAVAQEPAPPTPTAQELAPDVGRGAEEVAARLREFVRSLSDTAAFAELEGQVAAYTHRAAEYWDETGQSLARGLRTNALDSLTTSWQALLSDLTGVKAQIDVRAARREADLATLSALDESWRNSLDLAHKADAPPAVVQRVQDTLGAIAQTRPLIEQRRARVLVLQDEVSRAMQTCDDALARIADARRDAIRRALTAQEAPIWRRASGPEAGEVRPVVAVDIATKINNVRMYVTAYRGTLLLSALFIVGVMLLLRRMGARRLALAAPGTEPSGPSIFHTPLAAGLLIGLLVTRPLRPNPPFEFQQVMLMLVTIASVLVLRRALVGRIAAAVYACCALLVVNLTSKALDLEPRTEQQLLIVQMLGIGVILLWAARNLAHATALIPSPTVRSTGSVVAYVLAATCGVIGVAAVLGYLDLADFLGMGLFSAILLLFGVAAVRVALQDLVTIALESGPLAHLRSIAKHRVVVERRIRRTVDVIIALFWAWPLLIRLELLDPIVAVVNGILDLHLRAGELDLSLAHVLAFIAVVLGVVVVTRFVGTILEEDVFSRMTLARGVPYALSTLTRYTFLLVGFLLALATLGLDLTRITVLVSALGLGLGFGLQQIMNNFVSGLILLFERPVNVGDSIQMGDLNGDVQRIGIRSSTVRTSQGADVIVPNSKLLEEKVTNWTLTDRRRRIELDIGVKGDLDAQAILATLCDVATSDARVSTVPPPEALLVRFGDDSTDFQLRFWTDDPHWMRLRSDLSVTLQRRLRALRSDRNAQQPIEDGA
jgi:small-conductance mechanosensitive channel